MSEVIRPAKEEDIPVILNLLVQVNMVHKNGRPDLFRGPTTKYSGEELKKILSDSSRPIFVYADEYGSVRGYAFCIIQTHPNDRILTDIQTLYLDDLCVDEQYRGRQIGQKLYRYVRNYAKSIGCYNLTLNVWSCNPQAVRFYERLGLKPQKTYLEDLL